MPLTSGLNKTLPLKFELFKLLRVIGERTVQTIVPVEVTVPGSPANLVNLRITTADESFHLFTDKVVKQGVLVIEAVFCTTDGNCNVFTTTVPFSATVDIPGVSPNQEVDIQFRNVLIENDLQLVNGVLTGKVHLIEIIKISEFVQRFLPATQSPTAVHPRITTCG
ncbi:MAG: DUF3794 domain-containing protein [Firmicutes bacterium]|nr:DUF3794 domain-containing protein [Bacillota bacterium]